MAKTTQKSRIADLEAENGSLTAKNTRLTRENDLLKARLKALGMSPNVVIEEEKENERCPKEPKRSREPKGGLNRKTM